MSGAHNLLRNWREGECPYRLRPRQRGRPRKKRANVTEFEKIQKVLWSMNPCTSDHIPAVLKICYGLPVMIRYNDATELCITKGQEGRVVGWDEGEGSHGKPILETLFVELIDPPSKVQIPRLTVNVVPIPKSSNRVECLMPNDSVVRVERTQVNILPNFSMTDYASQGKTRTYNVIDLTHCKNHQSYYTCVSRSASAAGTAILQGFDTEKITKGINGYLRQEFLRPLRNPTIRAFQKWASENNIDYSSKWHKSLQWRKNEKIIQEPEKDGTWNLAYAKTREVIEREKNQLGKRKATGNSGQEVSRRKRQVTTLAPNPLNLPSEGR
ncbi:hypothetical protein CC1G_09387 [Coprinopsis cinerea okayama7|uniref:Uncharacterized protein n=1 Tax=Coprinopsis cinerea (strain Okayama-7 / 130 / ATCC MYA-4618 / FGSC 9003) TaxID=240176 RepID=A8NB27_COPC7|nr:hypothetical protein CC1G_09387 [Coprinopsis cinerea okayama7\|eukprot:XP_001832029.2 hypothetical protein CC1G_09387 [Coprinopsis cinerea okayama7\